MSKIMEKTLATLPKLLAQGLSGSSGPKMPSSRQPNQDVMSFMKAVHRAHSKSHEASIVLAGLADMEKKLQAEPPSSYLLRTSFSKAIFCHLLGYDVMFIAIHAIKLAKQGKGYDKKLGYLAASLLLYPGHCMAILMTGTIYSDLASSDMGDNFVALTMAGTVVDSDIVSTLLPDVVVKLKHSHDLVREKALQCVKSFYQRSPALLEPIVSQLGYMLSSRDPGVLSAVVSIFLLLCEKHPRRYTGLGKSFLHILYQINNRGFGSSYYYHMVPLPWLQISLLKVLALLGAVDPELSQSIAPIVQTLIEKTKVTEPISLALLVESIRTATKISAPEDLLQLCSRCITKLLSPDAKIDMRFQGLGLLIALSRLKPRYAAEHQAAVVQSLGDPDPALQQRTTELLHSMANRANVKAICSKLFEQIDSLGDSCFVSSVFSMIADLIERFSDDLEWYTLAYLRILQHKKLTNHSLFTNAVISRYTSLYSSKAQSEQIVPESVIESLYQPLETPDSTFSAVSLSISLFGVIAPNANYSLCSKRMLAVMGTFLFDSGVKKSNVVIHPPCYRSEKSSVRSDKLGDQNHSSECVQTLMKLVLSGSLDPEAVSAWLCNNKGKLAFRNLRFRCDIQELEELVNNPQHLELRSRILFGSEEDLVDLSLSFLDPLIVQHYLEENEVPKPQYLLLEKKIPDEPVLVDMNMSHDLIESQMSMDASMRISTSQITHQQKGKWREEDEEDDSSGFILTASQSELEVDAEGRKRQQMTEELFAGLTPDSSEPAQAKSAKSLWDSDDEDDQASKDGSLSLGKVMGLQLNPFGISKKPKSLKSSPGRWMDDNSVAQPGFEEEDFDKVEEFLSAQVEKVETPSASSLGQSGDQFQLFSSFPSPASEDLTTPLGKSGFTQSLDDSYKTGILDSGLGSREHSGAGLSIYSESETTADGADQASTVDTLTDSEPDED